MIIDYLAFGDELEKIAKNRLQQMYESGKLSLDDVLSAVGRRRYHQRSVSGSSKGAEDMLTRIKKTRYMKKGLSEKEADQMARASASRALYDDSISGSLRQELKQSAAAKRGVSPKEMRNIRYKAVKEHGVLSGMNQPHVLVKGWGDDTHAAMKALSPKQRAKLREQAAQLGMKREMGGTRTSGSSLFRGKLREDIEKLDDARIAAERAKREATRTKPVGPLRDVPVKPAPAPAAIDPKVQAQMDEARARAEQVRQQAARQQAELEQLRSQVAAPTPAPTPPPAAAPAPPAAAPAPAATPSPAPAPAPAGQQGGLSPMAIAGLGLGAAGVAGAGAYGLHRLRQLQAQQAQQGA